MDHEAENKEARERLLFALSNRSRPILMVISTDTHGLRKEIEAYIKEHLNATKFHTLDLSAIQVDSLYKALQEHVPAPILQSSPLEYMVHITGLENSLLISHDGQIKASQLLAQINFERELLFRSFPFSMILWANDAFVDYLYSDAQDFSSWLSYCFRFKDGKEESPEDIPKERGEPIQTKGAIAARKERIDELEKAIDEIRLNDNSTRAITDKINLLSLIGKEYYAIPDYTRAAIYFEKALGLAETISNDPIQLAGLYYDLAAAYAGKREFAKALLHYHHALAAYEKGLFEMGYGNTYHQIGMVYEAQRKWDEALENYQLAIDWDKKTGNEFALGNTYHQIGMVYEAQRKWKEALENCQKAIDWKTKTGYEFALGGTYHHIGRVYEAQRKWDEALEDYQLAIDWKTKTGNEFVLGYTYHQIGRVYEAQRKWKEALENYQLAIEWKTKTGNEFALGGTYHQIGRVYEEQRKWKEALHQFEIALQLLQKHDYPEDQIQIVENSIERVKEKHNSIA